MRLVIALLLALLLSSPELARLAAGGERLADTGAGPLVYWTAGVGTIGVVKAAGLRELAVPVSEVDEWRKAGLRVVGVDSAGLSGRRRVAVPKLAGRGNVASATRRPWIDANGWMFTRHPREQFIYDELPAGKAAIAAAEAYAYGVDALLPIAAEDLKTAATVIDDLRSLPVLRLPVVADFTVVDNDSPQIDEVLNLLTRRNLLYRIVPAPIESYSINIRLGTREYPDEAAADPSAFAQTIRLRLGDQNRSLRVYGSEVVIARLTGDVDRARVHLLNYSGRQAEGLRIRVRGNYRLGALTTLGLARQTLEEPRVEKGSFEGTIPKMGTYAVIDLR